MRYQQALIAIKVLLIVLTAGLFYVQIIRGEYYDNLSKKNTIRVVSLEAARGRIFDRTGQVIADTIPSFDISVVPQEVENISGLLISLAEILGIPADELADNYNKNYLSPFIPVVVYEKLKKDKVIALEERKFELPGVIIEIQPLRYYPFGESAAHAVGYLGEIDISRITLLKPYGYQMSDLIGYSGVEEQYDLVLRGEKGGEQVEVDNRGRKIRTVGFKPAQSGGDIYVTLDMRIQKIIDEAMIDKRGAAVMMDPFTGEIIALSSYPGYDPNDFIKDTNNRLPGILSDKYYPLLNRAISGQYPPGSVFKIAVSIAALQTDRSAYLRQYTCNGFHKIGRRRFSCWSRHGDEVLSDAIAHSCNVYFYNLGIWVGPDAITKYAMLLGLGRKTGVDLSNEAKGFIPVPAWKKMVKFQSWLDGDTANISIGQGEVLVTPLQLARMASVLINGGKLVSPHLIKAIGNRAVKPSKERPLAIDPQVLEMLREYVRGVVESADGSARIARVPGLTIVAKTGTAQTGGKVSHGWFVGYVGAEVPRYAFCIFLEHGGSSYRAALVAKQIFTKMQEQGLF